MIAFVGFVIIMSAMASGDPTLDGRNTTLAAMNLIGKLAIMTLMGIASGSVFRKHGWWIAAIVAIALIAIATEVYPRSILLSIYATDSLVFNATYVLLAAGGAKVGELLARDKEPKGSTH